MSPADANLQTIAARSFEAIVVGGSAGALEALRLMLPALTTTAAPLAIVLHLPRQGGDLLQEVLQPYCAAPVKQAEDKETLAAGTVYLAPPGYHLLIEDDRSFAFSVDDPINFSQPAIDVLFESAAHTYGSALLAILLSGASDDGAAGLATVKATGGCIVVQDPASASAAYMPSAAAERCPPDARLAPAELARLLSLLPHAPRAQHTT